MNNINCNFDFQKEELEKYLNLLKIDNISIDIDIKPFENHKNDTYSIKFTNNKGFIYGNTKIALTNGIYAFLEHCGIRFIRPGKNGVFIPKNVNIKNIDITSEASFKHRGICIEGAVSEENVFNIIDWETKLGMNTYFTQFRQSHLFFLRWYQHYLNPNVEKTDISLQDTENYIKEIINEIDKRGIVYHAVGHGWTCTPFGYSDTGWETVDVPPSDDVKKHLAMVNGKRFFWSNCPMNTNLCYSNPETRQIVNNNIKNYLQEHPSIDVLHFWLADSYNNECECEECKKMRPADYYVMMLNELDEMLTESNIKTKIVFLIYYDLLWPPEFTKFKNPDRFILMFAPITRTYLKSFADVKESLPICEYTRNNIKLPTIDEEQLGFFDDWRKIFNGDNFVYDYYLMWFHYKDISDVYLANLINKDIKTYNNTHLKGLISCQTQRRFMPTSLPMYVMAKTLWNKNLSFEEIEEDYFKHAFGETGKYAKEILYKLKDLWKLEYFIPEFVKTEESINSFKEYVSFIEKELPNLYYKINNKWHIDNPLFKESWDLLTAHLELTLLFGKCIISFLQEDKEHFKENLNNLINLAQKYDSIYQNFFDCLVYIDTLKILFFEYVKDMNI